MSEVTNHACAVNHMTYHYKRTTMHVDWDNTMVMGISGIKIEMPSDAKVSIFTNNDLTHINDDHFK